METSAANHAALRSTRKITSTFITQAVVNETQREPVQTEPQRQNKKDLSSEGEDSKNRREENDKVRYVVFRLGQARRWRQRCVVEGVRVVGFAANASLEGEKGEYAEDGDH